MLLERDKFTFAFSRRPSTIHCLPLPCYKVEWEQTESTAVYVINFPFTTPG